MSPLVRRCSRLVCLLIVLWTVGRSAASQAQPPAGVGTALQPSEVLRLIVHDITSQIQPLVNKLESRIDRLDSRLITFDSRLDTRLNGIEARLNALDFKQHSFDAKLDGLSSRMDSADNRPDDLVSRVDALESSLASRLDELVSRVNSTEDRLDSRLDELVSRVDSADNRLDSRLDELVSRVNSTGDRLDSRLEEVVSADNIQDSRLNELVSRVDGLATEQSGRLDSVSSRLDGLSSRLDELANRTDQEQTDRADPAMPPRDCSELAAGAQSGVHLIQPGMDRSQPLVEAYCDLETDGGGWTVIQRRTDKKPRQEFNLTWSAYRDGFGELDAEFWWGLEKLWRLTGPRDRQYELRVDLADFDGGRRHAIYRKFRVESEAADYRLFVANYTGDAGDSLSSHSGQKFSTPDRDHDSDYDRHCAQVYKSGWWFIKGCYWSNLNGQYLSGQQDKYAGVSWYHWRGHKYSLKETAMMVRPVIGD